MKRALNIYHLINFLHVVFYGYIAAQVFNIANVHMLVRGKYRYILIVYLAIVFVLSIYAKKIGKGLKNPVQTISLARNLNFAGIAALVLGVILSRQINHSYIYLVPISVPLSAIAFVLAYRGAPKIKEEDDSLLDELTDE